MAIGTGIGTAERLVDAEAGIISREIFVNPDIYQQELEQIFARTWLFVGHESQVSKPGDYFISSMGEESVILCRDRESRIHVFLNSCRHRGMKVCRYDEGNTPVFTCPYHGWSYSTDGALVGVPFYKNAYHEKLDKANWGLVEVAQMYNYKGSIWATWDKTAPPFLEYLGGFKIYLDLMLDSWDGQEGGTEVYGGIEKWQIPCNWKFPSENFVGDNYHDISHRSVDIVGIGPSGTGRRDSREKAGGRGLDVCFPETGHGTIISLRPADAPITASYQDSAIVSDYFRWCEEERKKRTGKTWRLLGGAGTVFPNTSYLARQPRTISIWHPRGADDTEAWRWFLVDKGAPQEVKDFLLQYYIRYSGPSGMTEQDDMENWNYAHTASRGVIARRHPYNYEMGVGMGTSDFEDDGLKLPGLVLDRSKALTGELNQRAYYGRWAQFMDAPNWDHLSTWRNGT